MATAVISERITRDPAYGTDDAPVLDFQQRVRGLLSRSRSVHGPTGQMLPADAGSEELLGGDSGLPALPRGAVTEILSANASTMDPAGDDGALALLLPLIRRLSRDGRTVAVVDHNLDLHPPGLAACGVDLRHILILRPRRRSDALWAAEACAKNHRIALTLLPASRLRDLDVRRLSLAAGEGQGVLVLLRPAREEALSAPCALRLRVRRLVRSADSQPASKVARASSLQVLGGAGVPPASFSTHPFPAFQLEVLRARGTIPPSPIMIGVHHDSPLDLHLVPQPKHRSASARVTALGA